jgi:glycosyltransferase involved in cell wall biosynthesis
VTHTLDELRERGVPGFEVEVVGTDHNVDRRLSAVAEIDIPFYAGLKVGVPSLPAIVEALAEGRYDLVHLCSPGPSGAAAAVIARVMGIPVLGSYHTELAAYAGLRSQDASLEVAVRIAIGAFYGQCRRVLSPSAASDEVLRAMGIPRERIGRWDRGVDLSRFSPQRRDANLLPGEITVLYAGRLTREKGADLLADAFLAARERDPRLHLALAGGGPEEGFLRERLGEHATFLGWLEGDDLARAYASADIFLFASRTDTFGQVLLEAQASGLAVVAVGEGGPTSIVTDGATGRLCRPDASALAAAVNELAVQPLQRERLARTALDAVAQRTWERSLQRLADGYRRALDPVDVVTDARRAA